MEATAPACIVADCNELSALSVRAEGKFWIFTSYYCSECYAKLLKGERPKIDTARLWVEPKPDGATFSRKGP
jgi:hypothetical protein